MADVFYSVRPAGAGSGSDLKVACNIVIASGVATFSAAQTGDIGVGCYVLSTNTDGYISEMTDSTHAKILTALGATHANVSSEALTSIYHPYASLSAAEAGSTDANHLNSVDLTAEGADVKLFWPCYGATVDSTACKIDSYTTDATHYITIYTPQGGTESINAWRHKGKWSNSYFHLVPGAGTYEALYLSATGSNYTRIIGLQVDSTSTHAWSRCIEVRGLNCTIDSNIVKKTGAGGRGYGIACSSGVSRKAYVINNLVIDTYKNGISFLSYGSYIINNTVINAGDYGIYHPASNDGSITRNNIVANSTTADFSSNHETNCISSDTSANGTNCYASATMADIFTDYSGGDYTLKSDGDAVDNGYNESGVVDTDIIGTSRPQSTVWDIGAFEFSVAVTAGAIINQFQKANLGADLFNGSLI